jgi:hypothetical protein
VLQPAQHDVGPPLRLARDRQPGEQRQQLPQRGDRLKPGERRAEAEVNAVTEREVALPVTGDGELLRVRAQRLDVIDAN